MTSGVSGASLVLLSLLLVSVDNDVLLVDDTAAMVDPPKSSLISLSSSLGIRSLPNAVLRSGSSEYCTFGMLHDPARVRMRPRSQHFSVGFDRRL